MSTSVTVIDYATGKNLQIEVHSTSDQLESRVALSAGSSSMVPLRGVENIVSFCPAVTSKSFCDSEVRQLMCIREQARRREVLQWYSRKVDRQGRLAPEICKVSWAPPLMRVGDLQAKFSSPLKGAERAAIAQKGWFDVNWNTSTETLDTPLQEVSDTADEEHLGFRPYLDPTAASTSSTPAVPPSVGSKSVLAETSGSSSVLISEFDRKLMKKLLPQGDGHVQSFTGTRPFSHHSEPSSSSTTPVAAQAASAELTILTASGSRAKDTVRESFRHLARGDVEMLKDIAEQWQTKLGLMRVSSRTADPTKFPNSSKEKRVDGVIEIDLPTITSFNSEAPEGESSEERALRLSLKGLREKIEKARTYHPDDGLCTVIYGISQGIARSQLLKVGEEKPFECKSDLRASYRRGRFGTSRLSLQSATGVQVGSRSEHLGDIVMGARAYLQDNGKDQPIRIIGEGAGLIAAVLLEMGVPQDLVFHDGKTVKLSDQQKEQIRNTYSEFEKKYRDLLVDPSIATLTDQTVPN